MNTWAYLSQATVLGGGQGGGIAESVRDVAGVRLKRLGQKALRTIGIWITPLARNQKVPKSVPFEVLKGTKSLVLHGFTGLFTAPVPLLAPFEASVSKQTAASCRQPKLGQSNCIAVGRLVLLYQALYGICIASVLPRTQHPHPPN